MSDNISGPEWDLADEKTAAEIVKNFGIIYSIVPQSNKLTHETVPSDISAGAPVDAISDYLDACFFALNRPSTYLARILYNKDLPEDHPEKAEVTEKNIEDAKVLVGPMVKLFDIFTHCKQIRNPEVKGGMLGFSLSVTADNLYPVFESTEGFTEPYKELALKCIGSLEAIKKEFWVLGGEPPKCNQYTKPGDRAQKLIL